LIITQGTRPLGRFSMAIYRALQKGLASSTAIVEAA
jgi:hypothetical protein